MQTQSFVGHVGLPLLLAMLALSACSSSASKETVESTGGAQGVGGAQGIGGMGGTSGVAGSFSGGLGGSAGSAGTGSGGVAGASGNAGAGAMGGMAGSAGSGAAGGSAGTGGSSGSAGSAGSAGSGGTGGFTLPPIDDYTQDGPFPTTVDEQVGPNGAYTVYRPEPLSADGFLHAPIIFGPGIGQSVNVHTQMLTIFASHGFIVVGTPVLNGGPGNAENRQKLEDGLNWILEQNDQPGIYQGKIYADHAISMGFSVGGTSAVEVGGHEAVATVVSIHGHGATAALHGTMLQTTGERDTVGIPLQQQTFDASQVQTFLAMLSGAEHGYIESNAGGDERPAIVAWMRYWIYNDTGAESYFFGDDCVLCQDPWMNPQRKNWPQ